MKKEIVNELNANESESLAKSINFKKLQTVSKWPNK